MLCRGNARRSPSVGKQCARGWEGRGGAFLRGADVAGEALESSSLLRLTGMEAARARVAVRVSVT